MTEIIRAAERHGKGLARARETANVEPRLFASVGLALDTIEVAAMGVVVWQLFRLRRDIMAMLRVMRRIDRKTADHNKQGPATSRAE
jgi:hypothetical protein